MNRAVRFTADTNAYPSSLDYLESRKLQKYQLSHLVIAIPLCHCYPTSSLLSHFVIADLIRNPWLAWHWIPDRVRDDMGGFRDDVGGSWDENGISAISLTSMKQHISLEQGDINASALRKEYSEPLDEPTKYWIGEDAK